MTGSVVTLQIVMSDPKNADLTYVQIYGAEHLLRLFGRQRLVHRSCGYCCLSLRVPKSVFRGSSVRALALSDFSRKSLSHFKWTSTRFSR